MLCLVGVSNCVLCFLVLLVVGDLMPSSGLVALCASSSSVLYSSLCAVSFSSLLFPVSSSKFVDPFTKSCLCVFVVVMSIDHQTLAFLNPYCGFMNETLSESGPCCACCGM